MNWTENVDPFDRNYLRFKFKGSQFQQNLAQPYHCVWPGLCPRHVDILINNE